MEFKDDFGTVFLDEIDLTDQRFKVSTGGPSGPLAASIQIAGVITPPILLQCGRSYAIISGFKRIIACKKLKYKRIFAQIYSAETPLEHCVNVAIIENALLRELNFVEQGRIIQLLDQFYSDQGKLCKQATKLGLPVNLDMAQKLRTVAQMNPVLQKALVEGHIALPVALQLKEMADDTIANKIAMIFTKIGLSLNRQREIIDWLTAISCRDGISVNGLLEDNKLIKILNCTDTDRKQKSIQVRQYLRKKRYPEMTKAEERYQEFLQRLNLGKGIQLIAPHHFEGPTYSIKIDFNRFEELIVRFQRLEGKINSPEFKALWDPFGLNSDV